MKKTFKVVMLPTTQSGLAILGENLHYDKDVKSFNKSQKFDDGIYPQHLYIISDDEIKEGDWFINIESKDIDKSCKKTFIGGLIPPCYKKIVATTDKSLLERTHREVGGFSGDVPLPQIPESFVQAYIKAYNEGKTITEVDLEYEIYYKDGYNNWLLYNKEFWDKTGNKPKFSTKEIIKTRPDNTVIVHQSKMYSREQVIELCAKAWDESLAVNVHKKDALPTNVHTTEPVHFNKFIQDNL